MKYKFTFLLLYCLISTKLEAALGLVASETGIHIYSNVEKVAILHLPKNHKFIEFGEYYQSIDEKLGSYQLNKALISKSRQLELLESIQMDEQNIQLKYRVKYEHEILEFVCKLEQSPSYPFDLKLSLRGNFPEHVNFVNFNFYDPSKAIFGGGIQFSQCNLKGQSFPLIVEENGIGRGDKGPTFLANLVGAAGNEHTSYAPMTAFMSSNGNHYLLNSGAQNLLWSVDFSQQNKLSFEANFLSKVAIENINIQLNNLSPLEQVSLANKINPPVIPQAWMNGYILGVQGGKEKVNALIKNLKAHEIEVSAIWIQDWVGKRKTAIGSRLQWDWQPNYAYYPDLKEWIDSLHGQDIKVLGYINPYFVEGGQQTAEGIAKEYFVKNDKGEAYQFKAGGFNACMVDLSNSAARDWVKNIIKTNLLGNGFDGWMCDFGEWLPFTGVQLKGDYQANFYHNDFPAAWTLLNYEAVNEFTFGKMESINDYFIFNRSWYSEDHSRPSIMWLGDQMGDFGNNDGIGSAVNAYNSASFAGFPIIHSDIGGYTAIKLGPFKYLRDDEVLKRWIEMEAFTPLWRSHEGLIPEHMSQIYQDDEMMAFFAKFDKIHHELMESHFALAYVELAQKGIPVVRHPFLMYPKDENTFDLQYQFFVGPNLLVCPVIEQGAQKVQAYLPEGQWQHYFTKEIFQGGKFYNFDAPIGQPAVFKKL